MPVEYIFKAGDLAVYKRGTPAECVVEIIGPCSVFGLPMYQIDKANHNISSVYVSPDNLTKLASDIESEKSVANGPIRVIECECGAEFVPGTQHYSWCPKHIRSS